MTAGPSQATLTAPPSSPYKYGTVISLLFLRAYLFFIRGGDFLEVQASPSFVLSLFFSIKILVLQ